MPRPGSKSKPLVGSPQSENVTTRKRSASASTAGAIHSHRPWMPGISTTGVPLPRSIIMSIPERFAGLQRVLNPFERLPFAKQAQESLTLEIEKVLFTHDGRMWHVAAGEDRRDLPADQRIVIRGSPGTPGEMHTELERRAEGGSTD